MNKSDALLCSFGLPVSSSEDAVCRHSGVLRTKVADCQFVSVERDDFYRILHQVLRLLLILPILLCYPHHHHHHLFIYLPQCK